MSFIFCLKIAVPFVFFVIIAPFMDPYFGTWGCICLFFPWDNGVSFDWVGLSWEIFTLIMCFYYYFGDYVRLVGKML